MRHYGGILKIAALLILLPIVLGKFTFSKTIRLYKDYQHIRTLEEQLGKTSAPSALSSPAPLHNVNFISNGRLVDVIADVCKENDVSIKQYEPQLLDSEGDYKLYSAKLLLSGSYVDLVRALEYRENNIAFVKISSLQFEYNEKRMKDGKIEMRLTLRQIEGDSSQQPLN